MIDALINEFTEKATERYPFIDDIVVFGSAKSGNWHIGSDLDIAVFISNGHKAEEIIDLYQLLWELDEKHGTRIKDAPALHPMIFIIDNSIKKLLLEKLMTNPKDSTFRAVIRVITEKMKEIFPRYSTIWPIFKVIHGIPE